MRRFSSSLGPADGLARSRLRRGGDGDRQRWYSWIGAEAPPEGPIGDVDTFLSEETCSTTWVSGSSGGLGYQWLGRGPRGAWASLCSAESRDALLDRVAVDGLTTGGSMPCEGAAPADWSFCWNTARLRWLGSDPGTSTFERRPSSEGCTEACGEYLVDSDSNSWTLCPSTCDAVQAAPEATLRLDAFCYE